MSHEPVRKQLIIEASQERAFVVFTGGIDRWWPREHHVGKSPLARAVLEPGTGGRWYSVCEDGTECDVGKVLLWEPSSRLVLAWQITAQWQYDANFETEIEVRFTVLGPRRTQVDFEHRNLDRYGSEAEGVRKMIDSPGGWHKTLDQFARAAAGD